MSGWKLIWREDRGSWVVRYRVGAKWRERSAATTIRREAERFLGKLQAEAATGQPRPSGPCAWATFREQLDMHHLDHLSVKGASAYDTALNKLESICQPANIADVTTAMLMAFRSKLIEGDARPATVANYVRHVRSALAVAVDLRLLSAVPHMPRAKRGEQGDQMRGWPLSRREFKAWRQSEPRPAVRFLLGLLWLSGMRLGEAASLDWSAGPNRLDLDARPYPLLRLGKQKGGRATSTPLPPALTAWLERVPIDQRQGPVVQGLSRMSKSLSRLVSQSGAASGVSRDGRSPTAHDLRRAFGTIWSRRVLPAALKDMMRHRSIATTMRYYVEQDAGDLGRQVWGHRRRRA